MLDGGSNVGLDSRWRGLRDVLHVREVLVAFRDSGRPPEVVDRERRDAALGETKCELLVEAVEPADVREDDDAASARLSRPRGERREPVPVGGLDRKVFMFDCRSGDDGNRRRGFQLVAHTATLPAAGLPRRSHGLRFASN